MVKGIEAMDKLVLILTSKGYERERLLENVVVVKAKLVKPKKE